MPTPRPAGNWPFAMGDSWLVRRLGVSTEALRPSVHALVAIVVVAFGICGAATIGLLPPGWFTLAAVVGATASVVLLAAMFNPYLILGFAIDAVLLGLILGQGWTPDRLG